MGIFLFFFQTFILIEEWKVFFAPIMHNPSLD